MDIPDQHIVVWCVVSADSSSLQYTLSVPESFVYIEGDKF